MNAGVGAGAGAGAAGLLCFSRGASGAADGPPPSPLRSSNGNGVGEGTRGEGPREDNTMGEPAGEPIFSTLTVTVLRGRGVATHCLSCFRAPGARGGEASFSSAHGGIEGGN